MTEYIKPITFHVHFLFNTETNSRQFSTCKSDPFSHLKTVVRQKCDVSLVDLLVTELAFEHVIQYQIQTRQMKGVLLNLSLIRTSAS